MKTNKQHNPTTIKADLAVKPDDGYVIELTANDGAETVGYATSEANAAFIVRAVNSHEVLTSLLKEIHILHKELNISDHLDNRIQQAIAKAEGK